MKEYTVALVGNPNSGKTTVFNGLTGSNQRVGNWAGVTVEKKEGVYSHAGMMVRVIDLPGTYSLLNGDGSNSLDEKIACDYILSQQADLIINIVDGSNLERNLYLSTQLLGLDVPVITVLNMLDIVSSRQMKIDEQALAQHLGSTVVAMCAHKKSGLRQLKSEINSGLEQPKVSAVSLHLSSQLQAALSSLSEVIAQSNTPLSVQANCIALRLLEGSADSETIASIALRQSVERIQQDIVNNSGEDSDILIADARYSFVHQIVNDVQSQYKRDRKAIGDIIDKIVLNRVLGIPLFFFIMYMMFVFAINIGGAFQDFFDIASDILFVQGTQALMLALHMPAWSIALVADGLGKGINTTLTFIPVIGAMFLFLSFLESSGYMARAAFVMDRLMQAVGLPGKAFVPMIVGFGCNVPAIMSARTLDSQRDRILTVMMSPFMSCSARLAIFTVFIAAFFPVGGQNVVFILYLVGIAMALLTGWLLRKTVLHGKSSAMVMELPPYHFPQFSALLRQTWGRLKHFLFKAGKIILPVCLLIGGLNALSVDGSTVGDQSHSMLSALGRWMTPLFAPMGVHTDNWPATVGLLMGMLAKEVVVATLNTLYSQMAHAGQYAADGFHLWAGLKTALYSIVDNFRDLPQAFGNPILASAPSDEVSQAVYGQMSQRFDGQVGAVAYLLFVLLYVPCVSTMAVIRKELSFAWMSASVIWSTTLAYASAVIFYQMATLAQHPASSLIWLVSIVGVYIFSIFWIRQRDPVSRHFRLKTQEV